MKELLMMVQIDFKKTI